MNIESLVTQLLALGGFAALFAVAINAGKTFGVVKDGQAPAYSLGLNLVLLVALFVVKVVRPDLDVAQADSVAGQLAQVGVIVLSLVAQLAVSKGTHAAISGVPVIGTSLSKKPAA